MLGGRENSDAALGGGGYTGSDLTRSNNFFAETLRTSPPLPRARKLPDYKLCRGTGSFAVGSIHACWRRRTSGALTAWSPRRQIPRRRGDRA